MTREILKRNFSNTLNKSIRNSSLLVINNAGRINTCFASLRHQSTAAGSSTEVSSTDAHSSAAASLSATPLYNIKDTPTFQDYKGYFKSLQQAVVELPEDLVSKSTKLSTLHARLHLPSELKLSTLSQALNCRSSKLVGTLHDNYNLSILGKNVLIYELTKYLNVKYPRLPLPIFNSCIDYLMGTETLHLLGKFVWGIELEKTTVMSRYLQKEPIEQTLGRLRYYDNEVVNEKGVELYKIHKSNKVVSEEAAYSLAVKSIVGGLHLDTGFNTEIIQQFIENNFIRKIPVAKIFQFTEPIRELTRLCERENLAKPMSKLISESGRLSKAPIFIVGVFSGAEKLGEGFGSSLKEAKTKAATDALLKYYCYEPVNSSAQNENTVQVIDKGSVIV